MLDPKNLEDDPELGVQSIQTIQRNGEHLLAIIDDILDLSKIESGNLAVESIAFAPAAIAKEVVDLIAMVLFGLILQEMVLARERSRSSSQIQFSCFVPYSESDHCQSDEEPCGWLRYRSDRYRCKIIERCWIDGDARA